MVDLSRMRNLAQALRERTESSQSRRDVHGRSWYRIENSASSMAEIYLYDFIGEWGVSAQDFVNELRGVSAPVIDLRINSEGGEIFDGLAIYEALRRHPARVVGTVDGIAASSASFVLMAADWRRSAKRARLMVHDGHGICIGNAGDMRDVADILDDLSMNIAEIYAERCGGTAQQWRQSMLGPTKASDGTWYDANAALAAGMIDEIAGDEEGPADRVNFSAAAGVGRPFTHGTPGGVDVGTDPNAADLLAAWDPSALLSTLDEASQPEPEPLAWDPAQFSNLLKGATQ